MTVPGIVAFVFCMCTMTAVMAYAMYGHAHRHDDTAMVVGPHTAVSEVAPPTGD